MIDRDDSVTLRERAVALRKQGLVGREIAERLGIGLSTAYDYFTDPDGSKNKERRERYAGRCADCGDRTYSGSQVPPERCRRCEIARSKAEAKWTRDAVINALRDWNRRYGETPTARAWNVAHCGRSAVDAQRWRDGEWPHLTTVTRMFGSWNAAIAAAGLEPREAYFPGRHQDPAATYARAAAMHRQGMTLNQIAKAENITPSGASYRVRAAQNGKAA